MDKAIDMTAESEANKALDRLLEAASDKWANDSKELAKVFNDHEACRAALTRLSELEPIIQEIIKRSHSHVDGRFLFEPLLHRKSIDIKKRLDGVETWYEGDWLSELGRSIKSAANILEKFKNE